MSKEWQMPRHGDGCAGCGRAFDVGEPFQACLYEIHAAYERRDFCLKCGPAAEPVPVGVWRTRRPAPRTASVLPFDREGIFAFFERLADEADPDKQRFRFVLALLLWRKRVIRFAQTRAAEGGEVWEFSEPNSDRAHLVVRPELSDTDAERLSRELEALLHGEPRSSASEPTHA